MNTQRGGDLIVPEESGDVAGRRPCGRCRMKGRLGRHATGGGTVGTTGASALDSQMIEMRRMDDPVAVNAEAIAAPLVSADQDDVGA